jgi:hypothetical protein
VLVNFCWEAVGARGFPVLERFYCTKQLSFCSLRIETADNRKERELLDEE